MAYCTWAEVVDVFERASDVVTSSAEQTIELDLASDLADGWLAPLIQTPVNVEGDGDYPAFVRRFTALLCADQVASRRATDDEITVVVYDKNEYTATRYGHQAMALLQGKRQGKVALEDEVTVPEAVAPSLITNFTTTNGTVEVKYSAGFFEDSKRGVFRFTISSAAGTVAGEDLTISCARDVDDTIWTDEGISSSSWYSVAHGLLVRFIDAAAAAAWTQNETFTVTCQDMEAKVQTEGVSGMEWNMG